MTIGTITAWFLGIFHLAMTLLSALNGNSPRLERFYSAIYLPLWRKHNNKFAQQCQLANLSLRFTCLDWFFEVTMKCVWTEEDWEKVYLKFNNKTHLFLPSQICNHLKSVQYFIKLNSIVCTLLFLSWNVQHYFDMMTAFKPSRW